MLEHLRTEIESFTTEISREYYLQGAGLKESIDIKSFYEKYPSVKDRNNIELIKAESERSTEDPEKTKQLRYLLENTYREITSFEQSPITEKVLETEFTGKIKYGEKEYFYRSIINEIINTSDRTIRETLNDIKNKFIENNLNPLLSESFKLGHLITKEFGFENLTEMFINISSINLHDLNKEAGEFLKYSEDIYYDLLKYYSKKILESDIPELKKHDLMYMMKYNKFDRYFPGNEMFTTIDKFVSGMGIDIGSKGRIKPDIEKRNQKSPRAFCSPVRIPEEIYLVINPRGGEDDYTTFLHELGHSLHFSHINPDLCFEYKYCGDNSVTEGFAMIFDHLIANRIWLQKIMKMDNKGINDFLLFKIFRELSMLRRYSAKLDYELKFYDDETTENRKAAYKDILSKAVKAEYTESEYLTDIDDYFYVARYLRAWMFQHSLSEYLNENFGEDWFINSASGSFLRHIWSYGQKYDANELLKLNNCSELSLKALFNHLNNQAKYV